MSNGGSGDRPNKVLRDPAVSMAAWDQLPKTIRTVLHDTVEPIDPVSVLDAVNRRGPHDVLGIIRDMDRRARLAYNAGHVLPR